MGTPFERNFEVAPQSTKAFFSFASCSAADVVASQGGRRGSKGRLDQLPDIPPRAPTPPTPARKRLPPTKGTEPGYIPSPKGGAKRTLLNGR